MSVPLQAYLGFQSELAGSRRDLIEAREQEVCRFPICLFSRSKLNVTDLSLFVGGSKGSSEKFKEVS